jgi:hypothetical protein
MLWGRVKSTCYPLHLPVSSSLPLPCVTVCHHISTGVCLWTAVRLCSVKLAALLQCSCLSWTFKLPRLSIFDEVHLTNCHVHRHCFSEHPPCAAYSITKLITATNSNWYLRGLYANNTTAVYLLKFGLQVYRNKYCISHMPVRVYSEDGGRANSLQLATCPTSSNAQLIHIQGAWRLLNYDVQVSVINVVSLVLGAIKVKRFAVFLVKVNLLHHDMAVFTTRQENEFLIPRTEW